MLLAVPTATSALRSGSPLTGYGATRKAWMAHHQVDPNPRLERGCCFLPRQNDGRDRYYAVLYDKHTRVYSYEMDFGPRVGERTALFLVKRDLPRDARLVGQKRKATCKQFVYRSAALKRALGYARVGVELSATGLGGPYRGVVGDAIVNSGIALDIDC